LFVRGCQFLQDDPQDYWSWWLQWLDTRGWETLSWEYLFSTTTWTSHWEPRMWFCGDLWRVQWNIWDKIYMLDKVWLHCRYLIRRGGEREREEHK
jgi:hypothetical protein